MAHICVPVLAIAALAGASAAQTVEFRIVERRAQSSVVFPVGSSPSNDAVLDLAVQARVTGINPLDSRPWALSGFGFDVTLGPPGESDLWGTLGKSRTSRDAAGGPDSPAGPKFSYYPLQAVNEPAGSSSEFGLAHHYGYAAGINASLNGNINTSSGTFVNTPLTQEIGLIVGNVAGSNMLDTPGMNLTNGNTNSGFGQGPDGNPDTWNATHPYDADNDPAPSPVAGDTALLDSALAGPYFGAGQFVDVYRFRYLVINPNIRTIHFRLQNLYAEVGSRLLFNNGLWGIDSGVFQSSSIQSQGVDVNVIPAPGTMALLGLGGLVATRRRRA